MELENRGAEAAVTRRPGRPSRAEAARRNEHLLDVATTVFIEQGYAAATMENIAAAAGCWKQAIYQRYGDKRALFAAVVKRLADRQPLRFPLLDERPLKAGLRMRIRFMLAAMFQPEGQAIFKLFLRNSHHFPELAQIIGATADQNFAVPLANYLQDQRRRGRLRKVSIAAATQSCMDMLYGRALRFFLAEGGEISQQEIDRAADEMVALLIGGLGAGA